MKKTVTANLGGSVFHIDEDAYQLLDKYLSNLRIHFRNEEGAEEIMNDFEMRFAELFNERIRLGYEVISIEQVEEVIRRMGKPEDLFDDTEKENEEPPAPPVSDTSEEKARNKRLMRDPDNRILGGVCSGLAAYMGWDATAIRLIFFLLIFLYGYIVPVYILLWIIMPVARTATERLQMRGERITVENIGKTVTDGFERMSHSINDFSNPADNRSGIQKIADIFVQVIGVVLKVVAVLAGIILFPVLAIVLLILFIVIVSLLAGGTGILYHLSPFGADWICGQANTAMAIYGSIGSILMIGIPLVAIAYAIGGTLFHWKPMATGAKWVLIILWIVSTVLFIIYIQHSGHLVWSDDGPYWFWNSFHGNGSHFYFP